MRGKKTLGLFDELRGKATTAELRVMAKYKYPKLSLHRTLHTDLRELLKNNLVRYDEETKTWYKLYQPVSKEEKDFEKDNMERFAKAQKLLDDLAEAGSGSTKEKEILKLSEPLNPHAVYVAKKEPNFDQANPGIYHVDLNKEPIWPSDEDPTATKIKLKYQYEKGSFKYRDKHQIAFSIIEAIMTGKERTTAIMYSSWLSHYQLKKYLTILLHNDLIEQFSDNRFRVTPKGLEFMDAMKKVSQIKFD
jgi:predicted transcriptional regulator